MFGLRSPEEVAVSNVLFFWLGKCWTGRSSTWFLTVALSHLSEEQWLVAPEGK